MFQALPWPLNNNKGNLKSPPAEFKRRSYFDLLACNETLTTSKGFTRIASKTPAVSPAIEKVYNLNRLELFPFLYGHLYPPKELAWTLQKGRISWTARIRRTCRLASGSPRGRVGGFPSSTRIIPPVCTSSRSSQRLPYNTFHGKGRQVSVCFESAVVSWPHPMDAWCTLPQTRLIRQLRSACLLAWAATWAASQWVSALLMPWLLCCWVSLAVGGAFYSLCEWVILSVEPAVGQFDDLQ